MAHACRRMPVQPAQPSPCFAPSLCCSCPAGWTTLGLRLKPGAVYFKCNDGSGACKGEEGTYGRAVYIVDAVNEPNFGDGCANGEGKVRRGRKGR